MAGGRREDGVVFGLDEAEQAGAFTQVSFNHLACLRRHWAWADDARVRFERERSRGWEYDADPGANRLYGAFYQWGALLCSVTEATLRSVRSQGSAAVAWQPDLDACLPVLEACRDVLTAVPRTREHQPRIIDLLREGETLQRLRRVHRDCGEALSREQDARERDMLDLHQP